MAVAFAAAVALHLLLLAGFPVVRPATIGVAGTDLQLVELQSEARHPTPSETAPARRAATSHAATVLLSTDRPAGPSSDNVAEKRAASRPAKARAEQALPAEVHARIMAEMHYPAMARRRGWQGEVALRLDVRDRSVREVVMLASSGYPLLDRAARDGADRLRLLPLADGFYRLPVVFRLQ